MRSDSLTDREVEFCEEFIKERGVKGWQDNIANRMGISYATVNTHKSNVFQVLMVNSTTELMHSLLTTSEWKYTKWEKLRLKSLAQNKTRL